MTPITLTLLVAGTGTGAAVDLATRRIPNLVVGLTALAGLLAALGGASDVTPISSLSGLAAGLALMLPGHLFGGTGAGDVKLFGAAGAVIGVERILWAFAYTAIAGGVLAVVVAIHRRRLGTTLSRGLDVVTGSARGTRRRRPSSHDRFAFGPAIAAGCLLAALLRG